MAGFAGALRAETLSSPGLLSSPRVALPSSESSCRCSARATLSPPGRLPRGQAPGDLNCLLRRSVEASLSRGGAGGKAARAQVAMPIGTPRVPYRTPGEGGWQWVDIWNVLYRERIIFLGQAIDEEFGNQIVATILYLDSVDSNKPMNIYINSPGGEMTPTLAIYDTIQSISSPVGTLALGYAYISAGLLLAAGTKGLRLAMPMTRVALQSPAGAARGQADDIQNEANELARVRSYFFSELSKRTGQPLEKLSSDLGRIRRFSAQEALEYGIIDRVVRPPRIKPDAQQQRQEAVGSGLG